MAHLDSLLRTDSPTETRYPQCCVTLSSSYIEKIYQRSDVRRKAGNLTIGCVRRTRLARIRCIAVSHSPQEPEEFDGRLPSAISAVVRWYY